MFSSESLSNQAGIRFYNFSGTKATARELCWSWYIEHFDSQELTEALCDGKMPDRNINTSIVSYNHGPLFCKFSCTRDYLVVRVNTTNTCACVVLVNDHEIIILPKNNLDITSEICQDLDRRMKDRGIASSVGYY